jgi:hypothetical protein
MVMLKNAGAREIATSLQALVQSGGGENGAPAAASVPALLAVAADEARALPERARAVRLLGDVAGTLDTAPSIDGMLAALGRRATGELKVQIVLAQADRARRTSLDQARLVAMNAAADSQPGVVVAGAMILWQLGGADNEARLRSLALTHADPGVRGACRGRLAHWNRSGGWRGPRPVVLDPLHGGPSPAPRR